MKIFLTAFFAIILLSGCVSKNAFSELNMGTEEEKAIENTISSKMMSDNQVGGIFSAVYLNNIYPNMNKNLQVFYVSIFMKDSKEEIQIKLNDGEAMESKELSANNQYANLLAMKNKWTRNYLVSFKTTQDTNLNLWIDSGRFSSGPLKYLKDQQ